MRNRAGKRWSRLGLTGVLLWLAEVSGATIVPGTLPGQLGVDQTGAAVYRIPVELPPGIAGLEPELALVYHSRAEEGIAGLGWSVNGLSRITRCAGTEPLDGAWGVPSYDAADRFCLDGKRLVAIAGADGASGTEYRLEVDEFVKVVSHGSSGGGPTWFELWTKSGRHVQLGKTADSRALATGRPDVRIWAANRIADRSGNEILIGYDKDPVNGTTVPRTIDYAGNAGAGVAPAVRVVFHYEATPHRTRFTGGAPWTRTRRLSRIDAEVDGATSHRYRLAHDESPSTGRALLKSIERCDGAGVCLPATTFTWSSESAPSAWTDDPAFELPVPLASSSGEDQGVRFVDFDGDGRLDIIQRHRLSSSGTVSSAWRNTASGWVETPAYEPPADLANAGKADLRTQLVDLDGDGLADVVRATKWYTSGSTSMGCSGWIRTSGDWGERRRKSCLFDTDGDREAEVRHGYNQYDNGPITCTQYKVYPPHRGIPDKAQGACKAQPSHWTKSHTSRKAYLNSGSGWARHIGYAPPVLLWDDAYGELGVRFADVDGDGLADLIRGHPNGGSGAYRNTGSGWATTSAFAPPLHIASTGLEDRGVRLVDLNGDGLTDLLYGRETGAVPSLAAYLSTGSGWVSAPELAPPAPFVTASGDDRGARLVDMNGDGLADFAYGWESSSGTLSSGAYFNTGKGWQDAGAGYTPQLPLAKHGVDDLGIRLADVNGDGLVDAIKERETGDTDLHASLHLLNTPSGWVTGPVSYRAPAPTAIDGKQDAGFRILDLDGDGMADYAYSRAGAPEQGARLNPGTPEHIVGVVNGLGATATIEHRSLAQAAYASDRGTESAAVFPDVDLALPIQAVEAVTRDDGNGNTHTKRYFYGGAKWNAARRAFLAFRWMNALDTTTNVYTTTEYEQAFPFIGEVEYSGSYLHDGTSDTHLSWLVNYWKSIPLHGGKTVFRYADRATAVYEPNDGPDNGWITKVTTATAYDEYGNPTSVSEVTTDGVDSYTRSAANFFDDDEGSWLLGQLRRTEVTRAGPGAPAQTRTRTFDYVPGTHLLAAETVEPDHPQLTLTTTYLHDAFGNVRSETVTGAGLEPRTTLTTYEPGGRFPETVTNALGHREIWSHDARFGTPLSVVGPNGLPTGWTYDGFGREETETRADGTSSGTVHALCDVTCAPDAVFTITRTTTGASTVRVHVDALGRTLREETEGYDGTPIYLDTDYDVLGRVTRTSRPYYETTPASEVAWTTRTYDVVDRVVTEAAPNGLGSTHAHDGLVTTVTLTDLLDPAWTARQAVRESDALGRLVRVTDPLGGSNSYRYDAFDNLVDTADAADNHILVEYDLRGRKVAMSDPDMGDWCYAYDALDQLLAQSDARTLDGAHCETFAGTPTVQIEYDLIGRVIARTEAEGTTVWTYDRNVDGTTAPGAAIGTLRHVSAPGGLAELVTVDEFGRVVVHDRTIAGEPFAVSTSYDVAGRVDAVTYPVTGFEVRHGYTASGYLASVFEGATVYWQAAERDAEGHVTEALLGNGLSTTRAYDPTTGLVEHIQTGSAGGAATAQDLAYAFGPTGNLLAREDFIADRRESFTYDPLERLKTSNVLDTLAGTPVAAKSYDYDAVGNITYKSDVGAYHYAGPKPHAVTATSGVVGAHYVYDANGNMEGVNGRTITWTSFNKPRHLDGGTSRSTFLYGADRARVQQTVHEGQMATTIKYVGVLFDQHTQAYGPTEYRHHVFAGGERVAQVIRHADGSPGNTRYLHTDHLGSIDTVTNGSASIEERLAYDPHGKRRETDWSDAVIAIEARETNRGFTDHEHLDGVGLVHMNGRVYEPELGRFLSPDPILPYPRVAGGLNRYTYARNNPLSWSDPSGFTELFGGSDGASVGDWVGAGNDLSAYDGISVFSASDESSRFSLTVGPESIGRNHAEVGAALNDVANTAHTAQGFQSVVQTAIGLSLAGRAATVTGAVLFDANGVYAAQMPHPVDGYGRAFLNPVDPIDWHRFLGVGVAALGFGTALTIGSPVAITFFGLELLRQTAKSVEIGDPLEVVARKAGLSRDAARRAALAADFTVLAATYGLGVASVGLKSLKSVGKATPAVDKPTRAGLAAEAVEQGSTLTYSATRVHATVREERR